MRTIMSKGYLIFAHNTKDVNYVEQAYALALSIKHSQAQVTSVSLVTNDTVPKKCQKLFDNIIPVPWSDNIEISRFAGEHRWKLFHVTPYDETIVLDSDMLFLEDVSEWWNYCSNYDLKFCSQIKNYKLEKITDTFHRKAFISNKLTNPYFALHYFKKSQKALEFYKTLEFVCNNWEWCYDLFAKDNWQDCLSMDLATAIAIEITGFHECVIDNFSPLEFIHMKSAIQGWPVTPVTWQDAVPYVFNSKGDLVVGNIKQSKLFHYVEPEFLSKKVVERLEELVHDKEAN